MRKIGGRAVKKEHWDDPQFAPRGEKESLDVAVNIVIRNSPRTKSDPENWRSLAEIEITRTARMFNYNRSREKSSPTFGEVKTALLKASASAKTAKNAFLALPDILRNGFVYGDSADQFVASLERLEAWAEREARNFAGRQGRSKLVGQVITPARWELAEHCAFTLEGYDLGNSIRGDTKGLFITLVCAVYDFATGADSDAPGVNLTDAVKFAVARRKTTKVRQVAK